MTEAEATERLQRMVAHDQEPVLAAGEVTDLVALAKRPDTSGVLPAAVGWVPTWDLNAAAAEGWRWKAGKVAHQFGFAAEGQSFQRQQKHASCLAMARHYTNRVLGTIPLAAAE